MQLGSLGNSNRGDVDPDAIQIMGDLVDPDLNPGHKIHKKIDNKVTC